MAAILRRKVLPPDELKLSWVELFNNPSQSYGVSLAIMGSHSVTYHPTQENTPRLNRSQRPVGLLDLPTTEG